MGKAEKLLSLHRSAAHKGQQEAWESDLNMFEELKADDEDELRRLRGEVYQVATLYAMFQGVIFTALSQASLLTCQLWWCPVFLSVAVSFAAFLAIAGKIYSMGEVQEDIKETELNMGALVEYLDLVEEEGADLDLETAQPRQEIPRVRHAGYRFIASKDKFSALLLLTVFSAFIAYFATKSLCLHRHCARICGPPSPSPSPSP